MIPHPDPPPQYPPNFPWTIAMRWHDLLFMHWPINPAALRPLIPPGLTLDTYDSQAWIGVVPFRMTGIRPRLGPPLPWFSAFAELNVRTYVTCKGRSGVWFFSLDAANPVAVQVARWWFHLPYYDARMTVRRRQEEVSYQSTRTHRGARNATFIGRYRPTGNVYHPLPGQLDHFLTERYCLFSSDRDGQLYRGDIRHFPWPLQAAEAQVEQNTMTQPLGIELPDVGPLLHFARRLDVVAWRLQAV